MISCEPKKEHSRHRVIFNPSTRDVDIVEDVQDRGSMTHNSVAVLNPPFVRLVYNDYEERFSFVPVLHLSAASTFGHQSKPISRTSETNIEGALSFSAATGKQSNEARP